LHRGADHAERTPISAVQQQGDAGKFSSKYVQQLQDHIASLEKQLLAASKEKRQPVAAVQQIFDGGKRKPIAAVQQKGDVGKVNASVSSSESHKLMGVAPIEDQLMGMTEEMKQAMYREMTLHGGPVGTAINFVRAHPNTGWFWCANDGQACTCNGQVRFGSHAGGWPSFTAPLPVAGSVICNAVNFGSTISFRWGFHCQCLDTSEGVWQNARLRYNSVSYLQEAWITMTRVMAQAKLLPMSGDRSWGGEGLFAVRGSGSHDRTFMDIFLKEAAQYLPVTPSNCVEWAPALYMPSFPACTGGKQYSLDFEPDINKMYVEANGHIHCDNVHLPQCMAAIKFDVVLNTNVWEHEIEPFSAMQSLYNVMNVGAVMLFTVPFVAPYHGVPYDFYRYTKSGVTHVLERAGFCVPRSRMASGGDYVTDIALMAGVGPGDFSTAEIQQSYHRGYDNIPDGATVMMAVAYKMPPGSPCPA